MRCMHDEELKMASINILNISIVFRIKYAYVLSVTPKDYL